jgi:hypothetical protein
MTLQNHRLTPSGGLGAGERTTGPAGLTAGRAHQATPLSARPDGSRARVYTGRPRACGGIGRRARLRALWTEWSVEVRVLSGALGKPRYRGFFFASRRFAFAARCSAGGAGNTSEFVPQRQRCAPGAEFRVDRTAGRKPARTWGPHVLKFRAEQGSANRHETPPRM